MRKLFMALMAVAAISFVGCKPKNTPEEPKQKFFDMAAVLQGDYSYAKQAAAERGLTGAQLITVNFIVDKSINSAEVEKMLIDTVITRFVLGDQKTLTRKHFYKNAVEVETQGTIADGGTSMTGFEPEDLLITWYEAIRVIQKNCPALEGRSVSIYRSFYPEIENLLVYNFSVLDVVDAKTGEYIDCTPAPPM